MKLPRLDARELAAIYAGGVVGALARVGLSQAAPHGRGLPRGRQGRGAGPGPVHPG